MRLSVVSNSDRIASRMRERARLCRSEFPATARVVRDLLVAECRRVLVEKIYLVPIPLNPRTGKQQWLRTGQLLAQERGEVDGTFIVLTNGQSYALARYLLGTPQGRQIRSPGVQSVQWRDEAVRNKRAEVKETWHGANVRILTQAGTG